MTKTRQEIYNNRPTSPHITIYRKQISSVLSIFHRITGAALFFALSIVSWWFILWVFSEFNPYYVKVAQCGLLKVCYFLISFAGFYHLSTGVRHLVWDSGKCFSIKSINITGWVAVIASLSMTVIFWFLII